MKKNWIILAVVFFLALGLRFYDVAYPGFKFMDEAAHVPAATNYWHNGQFEPDNWEHPPLRHIIEYTFLEIFGNNPIGWRFRNVLFGAFTAVLTFLFALEISGNKRVALMAGLLMATDPLHIVMSRFTYDEIYSGGFFLLAILFWLKQKQRAIWLLLSAFFMGCALANKWYFAPCWLLICLMTMLEQNAFRSKRTLLFIISSYILIPVTVFMLSYYQWFGRGYTIADFLEFLTNAYYTQQSYNTAKFDYGLFFLNHISAWEWFALPIVVGQGTYIDGGRGEFILFINNLPIWILTIPAMIGLAMMAVKERCLKTAMPLILFCTTHLLFLFVKRPVFIYSVVPLLPFAFTAIAILIARITDKMDARLIYAVITIMLLWNLYLFPLVSAKNISVTPYRYILDSKGINIH